MSGTVTLRDVALRAGVSTAATSQALNDRGNLSPDTRARIKQAAAELGYVPNKFAAGLRSGRAKSVGFVMADGVDDQDTRRWALPRARQLTSLVRAAAAHGFTVTAIPESHPELVRGAQIDVLYLPDGLGRDTVLRAARTLGIPIVADDLYLDAVPGISLRTGYGEAARAGLDLLARTGAARIGFLVDEAGLPREAIGEETYRAWCLREGRAPLVAHVDTPRRHLARRVRELLDADADAIFSFCEEGPAVLELLEATRLVIPRDIQLLALCISDCTVNERLGVTHVCLHPERAGDAVFAALETFDATAGSGPRVIDLPWELVRGSSTR